MGSRPNVRPIPGRPGNQVAAEETNPEEEVRPLGRIMRDANLLTEQQVQTILAHQREREMRFGEAAVDLGLARREDVAWALSKQFDYPYSPTSDQGRTELVVASDPFGHEAEVFREFRSQLMMGVLSLEGPSCALAVLSPELGDGKTYVAANLAVAFSQLGSGGTLLVDADLRTPRQRELFGIEASVPGLGSILSGRAECRVIQPLRDLPSLCVLPAGAPPPNPLELVQRPPFGLLVKELLGKFEHVVVDTPSASQGADCRVIAAACGAAVVLARKGRSRIDSTGALLKALSRVPCRTAGVVMNDH